ncbi:MAG: hypothetical protein ACK5OO_10395 [Cyclobacteriaceae bacterium]
MTSWYKVLSSFHVWFPREARGRQWDRTRLRKGTTAETQTLLRYVNGDKVIAAPIIFEVISPGRIQMMIPDKRGVN